MSRMCLHVFLMKVSTSELNSVKVGSSQLSWKLKFKSQDGAQTVPPRVQVASRFSNVREVSALAAAMFDSGYQASSDYHR